ncbi:unnamed protein product [Ceutorhynchus assimilis]|uniref:Fatty acyl-CoA reductase n=1 Tax=Ceutorhynchus assimilis TaxID=467358 RepID=A0A9N9QNW2_9CUCU|nr:unnamed protein product [Ceutorhynchus assimilis]
MPESIMEKSEIKEFYKDTKIFITGATGFVGKTLIEKLLRTTEPHTIYILMREKKGKTINERLKKIFENPVFDILKTINPDFSLKIKTINGECGAQGLGISDKDKSELINNVNIIFHAAASVNFDENLKSAFDINFDGIRSVINIAKETKHLKSLLFVSTAYSNCIEDSVIQEKVYEYPYDDVIKELEMLSKEKAELVRDKIIGNWPNTYTYTKALAEILAKREKANMPIGIFRPSIITSTYREPKPGWIDNIYAVNGVALGLMTGFLRVMRGDPNLIADIVPVDMCIAAMISSAKEIAGTKYDKEITVYNYVSRNENPITFDLFKYLNCTFGVPSNKALWYPRFIYASNDFTCNILSFILHIVPAILMDTLALLTGNKPVLVSLYRKFFKFSSKVTFFGTKEFQFDNNNVQTMWKKLNKTDRELFPFSMSSMSWLLFCKNYSLGFRRYILKEDDSMLAQAFTKLYRFQIAHYMMKASIVFGICVFIYLQLSKLWNIFVN